MTPFEMEDGRIKATYKEALMPYRELLDELR
jgi:hypothetical protein